MPVGAIHESPSVIVSEVKQSPVMLCHANDEFAASPFLRRTPRKGMFNKGDYGGWIINLSNTLYSKILTTIQIAVIIAAT